ncbi:MAG TPA: redoxin domain-containing protein [Candidatus Acidoferrales bacterium]|nr:redoxin domain-containing protein [Candidatus Acidoferrales bacterium]
MQLRLLTEFQKELAVNYCKLCVISVDPPEVNAAFRAGLGATFPFLSDDKRRVIHELDIVETSKSRGQTAIPYAFCLLPDLTVHNIYCGYWYVGRPTVEELRRDLREMMRKCRPDFDPQA